MQDVANPFQSIAPTSPIPVEVDYVILANATPSDPSKVKVINITK